MMRSALLTATVLLMACAAEDPATDGQVREPVTVSVTPAWSGDAALGHVARVESGREVTIATRTSGTLRRLPVDIGDDVRAGQVLAVLDDADVRARIAAAQAAVELAERTHGRVERLTAQGAASQQELDEAAARLAAALSALAEARAQAAYVEVTAPFDGVVVARLADAGDLASPGRPVLRLASSDAPIVVAELPSGLAGTLEVGDSVRVRTSGGEGVMARVSRVVPTLDPQSGRFRLEATPAEDATLRPGAVVRIEITAAGTATRWIPADAVVRRGQLAGVFALEGDTLRLRWLRLGRRDGDAVEVLAGPPGPLLVVRSPTSGLEDGQPVSGWTEVPPPAPPAGETVP